MLAVDIIAPGNDHPSDESPDDASPSESRPVLMRTCVRAKAAARKSRRDSVRSLFGRGLSDYEIARRTGVGRSTVQRWRRQGFPRPTVPVSFQPERWGEATPKVLRLPARSSTSGDGSVSRHGDHFGLHVIACHGPSEHHRRVLRSDRTLRRRSRRRWLAPPGHRLYENRLLLGRIWPLLFPQHGPGRKHDREIELVDWQQRDRRRVSANLSSGA